MEEGICPHGPAPQREKASKKNAARLRRYDRAEKTLTLTRAVYRRIFGNEQQLRASQPSRFLAEIPSELVDTAGRSMAEIGQTSPLRTRPRVFLLGRRIYSPRTAVARRAGVLPRASTLGNSSFGRSASRPQPADPMLAAKSAIPIRRRLSSVSKAIEDDRRLSVQLPRPRTKKFIERYAQLQPLSVVVAAF